MASLLTLNLVLQNRDTKKSMRLAWGQLAVAIVAAALVNHKRAPALAPSPTFAAGVVGTGWTLMRADFTLGYLQRLAANGMTAEGGFQTPWQPRGHHASRQFRSMVPEERADIIRMIVVLLQTSFLCSSRANYASTAVCCG